MPCPLYLGTLGILYSEDFYSNRHYLLYEHSMTEGTADCERGEALLYSRRSSLQRNQGGRDELFLKRSRRFGPFCDTLNFTRVLLAVLGSPPHENALSFLLPPCDGGRQGGRGKAPGRLQAWQRTTNFLIGTGVQLPATLFSSVGLPWSCFIPAPPHY